MYQVSFGYVLGLFVSQWLCIRSLLAMYWVSFGYVLGLFVSRVLSSDTQVCQWLCMRSLLAMYWVSFDTYAYLRGLEGMQYG